MDRELKLRLHPRADRGAVFVLAAMLLVVLLLAGGLVVDIGRQRTARRDAQALADVISLDMARLANGEHTLQDLWTGSAVLAAGAARIALTESANRNDVFGDKPANDGTLGVVTLDAQEDLFIRVEWGWFHDAKPAGGCAQAAGYTSGTGWFCPATLPSDKPDAARATVTDHVSFMFLPVHPDAPDGGNVNRSAVATFGGTPPPPSCTQPCVPPPCTQPCLPNPGSFSAGSFKVGSSLANFTPTPVTNTFLDRLLAPLVVDSSVLSYEGLAMAHVEYQVLLRHLGIDATTASPEELNNYHVSYGAFLDATASALDESGAAEAAARIRTIRAGLVVPSATINVGQAVGVVATGGSPAGTVDLNVLQLLTSSAYLVDGDHFLTIPGTVLNIPGVGDVGLRLTAIEAPRIGSGDEGAQATTSQIGLELTPQLNISTDYVQEVCSLPIGDRTYLQQLLGGLVNWLTCELGGTVDKLVEINVTTTAPITASVAEVTVTQHLDCLNKQLTLQPDPSVVSLTSDFDLTVSARLATGDLGDVANLHAAAGATTEGTSEARTFTAQDPGVEDGTSTTYEQFDPAEARVGSDPLGLSNLLSANYQAQVLNQNIPMLGNRIADVVLHEINQTLARLDDLLVQPIAEMLGLSLGGSDLTPLSLVCAEGSILVG